MYFLPANNESPVMVIKKHSHEPGRKESFDSGIGMQVGFYFYAVSCKKRNNNCRPQPTARVLDTAK